MTKADDILSHPHAFRLSDMYDLCKELGAENAQLKAKLVIFETLSKAPVDVHHMASREALM